MSKQSQSEVVDSWEDDVEDESKPRSDASKPVRPATSQTQKTSGYVRPTRPNKEPVSSASNGPSFNPDGSLNDGTVLSDASKPAPSGEERRPDKTTAIASRLIAVAIGQRPAQRTKEQREYDQAMKAQEKKKRDQAREKELQAQREKEQAKKDVWGD
jgi:hypothetical protein